ncbi:MAG: hypothetical protein U9N49_10165 [Campylobacterota bacterium]|nr:hypothetical protein [Campylobacterota bacterium]
MNDLNTTITTIETVQPLLDIFFREGLFYGFVFGLLVYPVAKFMFDAMEWMGYKAEHIRERNLSKVDQWKREKFEQKQKDSKMSFEDWLSENEQDLLIKFAETGADREMDFCVESQFDEEYEKYLNS